MTDSMEFKTASKRAAAKPITFIIDGRTFKFKPAKVSAMIAAVAEDGAEALRSQFDWLWHGLSDEDETFLKDRLRDLSDPLDDQFLLDIVRRLWSAASGRPTGSASG